MRNRLCFGLLAFAGLLAGCAHYQSEPLPADRRADEFRSRTLTDEGLRAFLATNGVVGGWPRESWDLPALSLAAFYYHPDMDLARARWHAATAGMATAAQRPNPNLAFTPRLNSSSLGTGMTPWILGGVLDIPVETMGKRKYRVAQARHLGEMAREIEASVRALPFPHGYHPKFLGEYAARQEARQRLLGLSLIAVLGMLALLQADFQSARVTALVGLTLPFALIGGVFAAWWGNGVLSLGSLIGFVTVLGIAARNGILLVSHYRHLEQEEGEPFGPNLIWRYRKGTSAVPANWKTVSDAGLDVSWLQGPGGFGYADSTPETVNCRTNLGDMKGNYTTACIRRVFNLPAALDPSHHLFLTVDWDDKFVAWLDGAYVASDNNPSGADEPPVTATA